MATQWFEYDDTAGTKFGIQLTDDQQSMYTAMVGALPTGYATLSALQVAVSGLLSAPLGLNVRLLQVTQGVFGTTSIPVLTEAAYAAVVPTGASPFPTAPISVSLSVSITGYTNESRFGN